MLELHKRGTNKQSQNKIKDGGSGREVRGEGEWGERAMLRKSGSTRGEQQEASPSLPQNSVLGDLEPG